MKLFSKWIYNSCGIDVIAESCAKTGTTLVINDGVVVDVIFPGEEKEELNNVSK